MGAFLPIFTRATVSTRSTGSFQRCSFRTSTMRLTTCCPLRPPGRTSRPDRRSAAPSRSTADPAHSRATTRHDPLPSSAFRAGEVHGHRVHEAVLQPVFAPRGDEAGPGAGEREAAGYPRGHVLDRRDRAVVEDAEQLDACGVVIDVVRADANHPAPATCDRHVIERQRTGITQHLSLRADMHELGGSKVPVVPRYEEVLVRSPYSRILHG